MRVLFIYFHSIITTMKGLQNIKFDEVTGKLYSSKGIPSCVGKMYFHRQQTVLCSGERRMAGCYTFDAGQGAFWEGLRLEENVGPQVFSPLTQHFRRCYSYITMVYCIQQGCQTHFHRGPHQPCGCLERAEYNFRTV